MLVCLCEPIGIGFVDVTKCGRMRLDDAQLLLSVGVSNRECSKEELDVWPVMKDNGSSVVILFQIDL